MAKKNQYLSNEALLREIHKSKITYCSTAQPHHTRFDLIVSTLDEATDEKIAKALEKRGTRERRERRAEYKAITGKASGKEYHAIEAPIYEIGDAVIRLMTYEHIPLASTKTVIDENGEEIKSKKGKNYRLPKEAEGKEAVNFPPFKHYVKEGGSFREVLRSHWHGDIETGHFSLQHGRTTDWLGQSYMELVNRYSSRANFRGYSYRDDMIGEGLIRLAENGLKFNEAKTDNPFAYLTMCVHNAFLRVLNLEKRQQAKRDDIIEAMGGKPSSSRQLKNDGW